MKVEKKIVKTPAFEPVQLTLTFETKDELDKFYAIFNHVSLNSFFGGGNSDLIRNELDGIVKNGYQSYHQKLCKIVR